ncbi:MAG: hypothetical protein J6R18_02060 [Kiritimatiellae bacterium]|nr:hypothetical protein [Kiritimatiellia bacterium]
MKKNLLIFAISSIAFLGGIGIGWSARSSLAANSDAAPRKTSRPKKQRIADAQSRVKIVAPVVTNVMAQTETEIPSTDSSSRQPARGEGFLAELERIKTEDPARYASMTNHMAQFRNRMLQRAENKLETLASIDTTGWSKSQIATHEKYQDLIARREELMNIVRHDSNASQQERDEAFKELRSLGRELHKTSSQVRNTLLDKTFSELGFNKKDSAEIRETIKTIYSTTEEWGGFGRGGPWGRRHHR